MDQMDNSKRPEHRIDGRSDNIIISSNWIKCVSLKSTCRLRLYEPC